jgi:mxaK protein
MKRRVAHIAFGTVALVCAAGVAYQGGRLQQSERINQQFFQATRAAPEAALQTYKLLVKSSRGDLKQAAQYNLGNLYMRDALRRDAEQGFESLPLIELAKQSYRDLLREHPSDWDARYNLERALRLAPEVDPGVADEPEPPEKEENVATTLQHAKIDLP